MRIIVDIGHPAHVHYFRNFIKIMSQKRHSFLVIAHDKDVTFSLLNKYKIDFISRGKGSNSLFGKFIYIFQADIYVLKAALKFKPDLFISFGTPFAAHVSFLLRKPNIVFSDTEHALFAQILSVPLSTVIFTPNAFFKYFGKRHIKFSGYMELCSLHPNYFQPDCQVLKLLGIGKNEKFILLRFVSWTAYHDIGQK